LGVAADPEAGKSLSNALKSRQMEVDLSHAVRCMRFGQPAEQIACEYGETLYDIVVVAAGRNKTGTDRLGETVKAVLEMTNAAVLVVKQEQERFDRVLICTAGGEGNRSDLRVGGRLAKRLGVPITLLHVARSPAAGIDPQPAVEMLQKIGVRTKIITREAEDLIEGIVAEANEGGYDLIVIGSSGPKSRPHLGPDDITLQALARIGPPVLIVPADEA